MIKQATLWKLAGVLGLAAVSALIYVQFLQPAAIAKIARTQSGNVPAPAISTAFVKLTALVDAQSEGIFSPLEGEAPAIPQQELLGLRKSLADAAQTGSLRAMNQTALQLCDTLLLAIQERERSVATLADARSKPHAAAMSANGKKEAAEKQKFFESSINNRWTENAKTYRAQVTNLRGRLREQERRPEQAPDPKMTAAQPGDTIILQHATAVRLKYGSATLPAGMSLRVVGRTATGLSVEYGSENVVVTLP